MRRLVGVLLAVVVALSAAPAAFAHARLLDTTPRDEAILVTAPREVRLLFDDPVSVGPGNAVVDAARRSVLAGTPRLEHSDRVLVLPLEPIGHGDYSVSWRIVSDDGHLESGVLAFRVGAAADATGLPRPVLEPADTRPAVTDVLARWLLLGGILSAGGTALFVVLVSRTGGRRVAMTTTLALTAAAAGGGWLLHATHGAATRFDHVTEIAVAVALVGALVAALACVYGRLLPLALAASLVLLLAPTLAGHAARAAGVRPLSVAVDLVHVGAAAFWIGGLLQLALLLRRGYDERVVRRFSSLALVAVALIALTGLGRAVVELNAVSQLWSTGYGRTIVLKSVLLVGLVLLGWLSRRGIGARQSLLRTVTAELVVLALVVGAVGVLTALRPGRDAATPPPAAMGLREVADAPPPPRGAVVFAREAGELAVALAVRPGTPQRLTATIIGQSGHGVDGLDVRLLAASSSRRTAAVARPCGHGCYAAAIGVSAPRLFQVSLSGGGQRRSIGFPVTGPWPPRAGGPFLARATKAFGALHSVVFSEHLASDPEHAITTIWKLVAPDSVEYSIGNGAAGIVIGRRRWDRATQNGPWAPSTSVLLPQPTPLWGPRPVDVRVMRESPASVTLSWVDPSVPAWYTATFDRTTKLPSTLRMTAPAHFMRHAYLAYNTPIRITAPIPASK